LPVQKTLKLPVGELTKAAVNMPELRMIGLKKPLSAEVPHFSAGQFTSGTLLKREELLEAGHGQNAHRV